MNDDHRRYGDCASADDGDNYVAITLDIFFNNMRRYMMGEPLQNVVRPELGY